MTGQTFTSLIRTETKTNEQTFTNEKLLLYANVEKDVIADMIVSQHGENYFDMEMNNSLQAGIRDYELPLNILKHLKYVSAKMDGTNYVRLFEAQQSQLKSPYTEEEAVKQAFAGKHPHFMISGRSIVLLSENDIPDAFGDGLKIICQIYPENLVEANLAGNAELSIPSSTSTHRLPRSLDELWATRVIVRFKQSKDRPMALSLRESRVDVELFELIKKLSPRNENQSFKAGYSIDLGYNY